MGRRRSEARPIGAGSRRAHPLRVGALLLFVSAWPGAAALAAQEPGELPAPERNEWPDDHAAWQAEPYDRSSEFWLPLGSAILPGLGQYVHGDHLPGFAYTAVTGLGLLAARQGDVTVQLPRQWPDQVAEQGLHLAATSGFLSAWATFRHAVEDGRAAGRYGFYQPDEGLKDLLSAPFDPQFLGRWTTWASLAQSALVSTLVIAGRDGAKTYEPFRAHDVAYAGSLSINAAIGEEAAFRGWLLPLMTQQLGQRFWLANSLQALIFGVLHPDAGPYALVIGAWGGYAGWQTRRNDWSVREVVFQHFWHNVMAGTAMLLTDEQAVVPIVSLRLPAP